MTYQAYDNPMATPAIDALAAHIGGVVVAWSRINWLLARLFEHLAGVTDDYVRQVLLSRLRDHALDETCKQLAGRLSTSDREAVRKWLKSVGELRMQRNELLHGTMSDYRTDEDPQWRAGRMRATLDRETGAVVFGAQEITADELSAFHQRVKAVHLAFFDLPETARPL